MTEPPEAAAKGSPDSRPTLDRPRVTATDEAALTVMYEEHRARLFGFLLTFTRDPGAAEDLLQDTFIRLIREVREDRTPDDIGAWLFRVATNAAISQGRHRAVFRRLVPRLLDRREPVRPDGEALRVEREDALHAALARLPGDARAALLLAAEGFSGREIAQLTRSTEGATRTRMSRARVRMRVLLEAREVEP